jgi:F-type H+-transporting ATPase subunit alpha
VVKSSDSRIPLLRVRLEEKGVIRDIKDTIVRIVGLPACLIGEVIDLGDGVRGIVMEFDAESVMALVLGDPARLRMGREVHGSSTPLKIPVGDACIGRMLTALGLPCDDGEEVEAFEHAPVLQISPHMMTRRPITEFLETGTRTIDILAPLGKGQRQLLLGDRLSGKTSIAVDALLRQGSMDTICIYCCIGKSISSLEKLMTVLEQHGALAYTAVLVATDNMSVAEQFLVPYSATTLADHFVQQGRDVLVIMDDMTKHAWAYRQVSLLLDRPPGREAYPGDIFYVQTQIMERAGAFNEGHGGGSMSLLCLAETQQGDLTGYIPSNLVSMSDGQIVLSSSLYSEGVRPAIDVTGTVSNAGWRTQPPLLRAFSSTLRAEFANYLELSRLSHLSAGMSAESTALLKRGELIRRILHQGHHEPSPVAEQILLLYALNHGDLDSLSDTQVATFCREILAFAVRLHPVIGDSLVEAQTLTAEMASMFDEIVTGYLESLTPDELDGEASAGPDEPAAASPSEHVAETGAA